jgi:hypothetical protein
MLGIYPEKPWMTSSLKLLVRVLVIQHFEKSVSEASWKREITQT